MTDTIDVPDIFDITVVIVFIIAFIIAYLSNINDIVSITILFFILYFIVTEISFDVSEVGYDFTMEYYIKLVIGQFTNYIYDMFNWNKFKHSLEYPEIEVDFEHIYPEINKSQKNRKVHQFVGSTPIDIFNNGVEYVFIGGSMNQADTLLKPVYNKNKLSLNKVKKSIISQISDRKSATYSAVSFDFTGNGLQDLLVSRQNGVILYENRSSKNKIKFVKNILLKDYMFDESAPIALAIGDVNMNGKPDILISQFTHSSKLNTFQFNNDEHWAPNILLENVSSNNKILFVDSTDKYNLSGNQNTFTSSFVILDNYRKHIPPHVINANDTGELEIHTPIKNTIIRSI